MLKKILCLCCVIIICQFKLSAQSDLDSLKQLVLTMPEDSIKCERLLDIAFLIYNGEEAEAYSEAALLLAKKIDIPKLAGKSYYALAWTHGYDEMDKKKEYLDSAINIYTAINDLDGLGLVYNGNGVILLEYGVAEDARAAFEKSHGYFVAAGNVERQAVTVNNWGVALNDMGKPAEAMVKFQEALDFRLKQEPQKPINIGRVYFGLGQASRFLGNLSEATDYYLLSHQYRKKANNIAVAEVLIGIANMVFEAAEQGQDTIEIMQKVQTIGIPNSIALLDSALAVPGVSERISFLYTIIDARRRFHVLYGNFDQAYDLLLEQKKIDEEHKLSASSLEALADLKIQYEKQELEVRLLEKEVSNRKQENQVNLLVFSLGILLLILIIGMLVYQNTQKANSLLLTEAKQEQQNVAMRSMLEGQEKERARIARDLHDGLGNMLSTVKVSVGSLSVGLSDKTTGNTYAQTTELIDDACTEVRKIAHEMMPQALRKLGLKKALEDLVLKMDSAHSFDAHYQVYGDEQQLDDNTNVMVFRMIQELFNNIVKYAEATDVLLQLTYSEEWLNLTIEDDGKGFELDKVAPDKGMGLKSIAFRADYIGAQYEIDSRIGKGTFVSIDVPLKTFKS